MRCMSSLSIDDRKESFSFDRVDKFYIYRGRNFLKFSKVVDFPRILVTGVFIAKH